MALTTGLPPGVLTARLLQTQSPTPAPRVASGAYLASLANPTRSSPVRQQSALEASALASLPPATVTTSSGTSTPAGGSPGAAFGPPGVGGQPVPVATNGALFGLTPVGMLIVGVPLAISIYFAVKGQYLNAALTATGALGTFVAVR